MHTTFSVDSAWMSKVGSEVVYPGVTNVRGSMNEERTYHAYYQWVPFVLFLQAVWLYTPRYIWRSYDNGRMGKMLQGLDSPIVTREDQCRRIKYLVMLNKASL